MIIEKNERVGYVSRVEGGMTTQKEGKRVCLEYIREMSRGERGERLRRGIENN